jgi:histidyl-tRNA synthetase
MKQTLVQPDLAGGFRDYLPADMIPRQRMLDTIRGVFERFGFVPLDTPGLEREAVLTGGDPNFKMQIFRVGTGQEENALALRFDLTVPLARVVAMHGDKIGRPFKRYQMGKVWRGEKPQAGRFREFIQFDADIVGSNRIQADAEIVALIQATLTELGLKRFLIRINNRKILNGLSTFANYDASLNVEVLRTLDKSDKICWTGVETELIEKVGLQVDSTKKLKSFLDLSLRPAGDLLDVLAQEMSASAEALEGIDELRIITESLDAMQVPKTFWCIDLSVARGLGYYTGPVFETILLDLPSIGSVFSGGRYDGLVERFSTDSVHATGASVGVDRLFAAMEQLNIIDRTSAVTSVVVLDFDKTSTSYCQEIVSKIRSAGISAELYLGNENNIKAQLAYALRQSARVVVIAGGNELKERVVQIKDLGARTQTKVPVEGMISQIREILTRNDSTDSITRQ